MRLKTHVLWAVALTLVTIASATAQVPGSPACDYGPCAEMYDGEQYCWELASDNCIEYWSNPREVTLQYLGRKSWGAGLECDACNSDQPLDPMRVTIGESREHTVCLEASWNYAVKPLGTGWEVTVSGSYCYSATASLEVQASLSCAAGTRRELRVYEDQTLKAIRWDESLGRELLWERKQANAADCQGNWAAYPHLQIADSAICGPTGTGQSNFKHKKFIGQVFDLDCPDDCQELDPASLGLPDSMTWSEFASWIGASYGISFDSQLVAGSMPGHDAKMHIDNVVTPAADEVKLAEGEEHIVEGIDFATLIDDAANLTAAQWRAVYEALYCKTNTSRIAVGTNDSSETVVILKETMP